MNNAQAGLTQFMHKNTTKLIHDYFIKNIL